MRLDKKGRWEKNQSRGVWRTTYQQAGSAGGRSSGGSLRKKKHLETYYNSPWAEQKPS